MIDASDEESDLRLQRKRFLDRYGVIVEDLRQKKSALFFNTIFIVRRLFLVLCLVFLYKYDNFQITTFLVTIFMNLCYISSVRPFEDKKLMRMELVNETLVMFTCYCFLAINNVSKQGIIFDLPDKS